MSAGEASDRRDGHGAPHDAHGRHGRHQRGARRRHDCQQFNQSKKSSVFFFFRKINIVLLTVDKVKPEQDAVLYAPSVLST